MESSSSSQKNRLKAWDQTGEIVQPIKGICKKPANLSLMARIYMMKGEKQLPEVIV